jgi:membrane protein implicated in regulation of membrane protease activity
MNWIDAVTSQVAMQPLSMDGVRALPKKHLPSALDDASVPGGLYAMASAPSLPAVEGSRGKSAGAVTRAYRKELGSVQKLFRWLNESAYLVSVPFLLMILAGIVLKNQPVALLGATGVVLLNIGRVATGLANLVVIPFRESPVQGVLFLIPPLTFLYLWQHWKRVRKPVMRVVGPIATIGLVVLAFSLIPWLRPGGKAEGTVQERLQTGAAELKSGIRGKLEQAPDVNVDVEGLRSRAQDAARSLEERVRNPGAGFGAGEKAAPEGGGRP